MRFAKDLETVAYTQHFPPFTGKTDHAFHDGTKPGDRSATEIVAIGEPAGEHDTIISGKLAKIGVFVPEHYYFLAKFILQGILHVAIAIRTRENDYSKLHTGNDFMHR